MFATIALALALQPASDAVAQDSEKPEIVTELADADSFREEDSQNVELAVAPEDPEPASFIIPRDTPVHLMVLNEVSTKDHEPGHRFRLRVNKPVMVDGRVVVPIGATAWGELTEAEKSGNIGKRGKLSATLRHIDLDGVEIPLDGGTIADGKSGKGETILGVLAMGPLGLFAKGNNAKIKAGEKMTAFVSEDVEIFDAR